MTAGIPISQTEINLNAGGLARAVFSSLHNVLEFKDWLDGVGAAGLENDYGFSPADAAVLVSGVNDMAKLAHIFRGEDTQGSAYDFRTFSKRLIGTGLY